MICLINLVSGIVTARSSSLTNLRKDSDCAIFNGRESKIIQFTSKLRSST